MLTAAHSLCRLRAHLSKQSLLSTCHLFRRHCTPRHYRITFACCTHRVAASILSMETVFGVQKASSDDVANPTIRDADAVIKNRFGFPQFREGQREVIDLLLSTDTLTDIPPNALCRTLASFPTGSGKYLCYQLPALLLPDGLTNVVSPVMELLRYQVDSLVRRNTKAAFLDSSMNSMETKEIYEHITSRDISILLLSPERFNGMRFTSAIGHADIALFAIDEAHCILNGAIPSARIICAYHDGPIAWMFNGALHWLPRQVQKLRRTFLNRLVFRFLLLRSVCRTCVATWLRGQRYFRGHHML